MNVSNEIFKLFRAEIYLEFIPVLIVLPNRIAFNLLLTIALSIFRTQLHHHLTILLKKYETHDETKTVKDKHFGFSLMFLLRLASCAAVLYVCVHCSTSNDAKENSTFAKLDNSFQNQFVFDFLFLFCFE